MDYTFERQLVVAVQASTCYFCLVVASWTVILTILKFLRIFSCCYVIFSKVSEVVCFALSLICHTLTHISHNISEIIALIIYSCCFYFLYKWDLTSLRCQSSEFVLHLCFACMGTKSRNACMGCIVHKKMLTVGIKPGTVVLAQKARHLAMFSW